MVAKGAKMPFIPRRPAEVRFEEKVQYDPNTGCWLWQGANDGRAGYGSFRPFRRDTKAHRFSYEHFNGKQIPAGWEIDHKCNTPACVNPDHLEAVTREENMRRASKAGLRLGGPANGRRQKERTHCPHGHSYADAYVNAQGHRACATCRRAKSLREAHNKRKNISQNNEVGA
jgi:hypothetical protein